MRHAVWYVTWKCNFACPYCSGVAPPRMMLDRPSAAEASAEEWARAWNRIPGDLVIDITGGEPGLFSSLIEVIERLEPDKRCAITTNGTLDARMLSDRVQPSKCVLVTMSYHPSAGGNFERFLNNALFLRHRGFKVSVNYVAHPGQMWLIPTLTAAFRERGIPFHVDPFWQGPQPFYTYTEAENAFLSAHVAPDRTNVYEKASGRYMCTAGSGYFVVIPNGEAYTCLSKGRDPENFLGNIFDEKFALLDRPIFCETKVCLNCDLDHTVRHPV